MGCASSEPFVQGGQNLVDQDDEKEEDNANDEEMEETELTGKKFQCYYEGWILKRR